MANEPLVTLAEIEAVAQWSVPADGAVVSDWAGRAAVPTSVAAELFMRAVAERDSLALERQERMAAEAAKWWSPAPVADEYLTALADVGMKGRG